MSRLNTGRIGGIGPAKRVADYAVSKGVTFANHTFTSHLALRASLQPFAGLTDHRICEFSFQPKPLSVDFVAAQLQRNGNGEIAAPDTPGLSIRIDPAGMRNYLLDLEIKVAGGTLYTTMPKLG